MDDRLFTNSLLYCEGRERTHLRGWFHFFMCISFFPMLFTNYIYAFYNSDKTDKTNVISFIACITNFLIIYGAHCVSAYYHICELPLDIEIFFQKFDIIGANLYIASSYLPMALLLFPTNVGALLIAIVSLLVMWNINCIITSNYALHQPIYICLLQLVFGIYIYNYLTTTEFILNCVGLISLVIGTLFLFNQFCPPIFDQEYFNYFEMYHGFSLICLTTTCLMNYSIFKRTTHMTH
jgi:predicted membrane channel-forming protein YqfA (hemolysin III family)